MFVEEKLHRIKRQLVNLQEINAVEVKSTSSNSQLSNVKLLKVCSTKDIFSKVRSSFICLNFVSIAQMYQFKNKTHTHSVLLVSLLIIIFDRLFKIL